MKYKYRKCNLETVFILLVLFFAVFNDVIRIPNTVITVYRLLLPLVLVMSLIHMKYTYPYFMTVVFLLIPFVVQNFIFLKVFRLEEYWDFKYELVYLLHYCSIIVIFILLRLLRLKDEQLFQQVFYKGMLLVGVLCMLGYAGTQWSLLENINFANINNYGCCLAVVFPWYFIQLLHGKGGYFFLCGIIFAELYWGDSKAALAGVIIEIGVVTAIMVSKRIKETVIYILIFIAVVLGFVLALSPIHINGYNIREMFLGMMQHIMNNELYKLNGSLTYRTNTIIYMIRGIFQSCFLGIGPGNSGKLLKHAMPEIAGAEVKALSSHSALIEFFCDCGIWAILLSGYIFVKAVKMLIQAKRLEKIEIYFTAFVLSFPMWVMSASGIYTIYLIFIVMAWLYENSKRRNAIV